MIDDIDFRWLEKPEGKVLQISKGVYKDGGHSGPGGIEWSEWKDVPTEVEDADSS